MEGDKQFFTLLGIALIVCRNSQGKWLAIKETKNRGWWLPGGRVDPPESFFEAAIREVKEEAGIDVDLKGILRLEYNISDYRSPYQRFKVVFYAEPKDANQPVKKIADSESEEARWVSIKELIELKKDGVGWRGPELYEWATYVEQSGMIWPLELLSKEGGKIKLIDKKDLKQIKNEK